MFVNQGEGGQSLPASLSAITPDALAAPAKLELELDDLPAEDRAAFAADLGLTGSQRDDVLRRIFAAMGQIVFLTVGEDECRAWPIPAGADAVAGAGQIHTDLAKRFVRAEVVGYDDFVARRLDEGGEGPGRLSVGREDVRGEGWGYHAYFGQFMSLQAKELVP